MKLNSLAFRLFATAAAWTLIVLPIAGLIIFSLYREDVQKDFDERLLKLVTAINVDSLGPGATEPIAPTNRFEPLFEVTHSGWYWQIKPVDGGLGPELVSASLATWRLTSPYQSGVTPDSTGTRWMNVAGPTGERLRAVEVIDGVGPNDGPPRYSIEVAGPLDWLEARNTRFRDRLGVALALAGIGLVALTLLQVRFGLLPLRRIEQGLAAIRSGDAEQLEGDLPSEIEPLRAGLNALITSNQDIVERARTHVGNLAHALKTPLAVILNEAREVDAPPGGKIAEQATVMRDQINHYLDRARMAGRVGVIGRVTPIEPVVAPLVRALERIHQDRGIRILSNCPTGARFQGERQDIEEILGNLLDNACKWAAHEVRLDVSLGALDTQGPSRAVMITVDDDGPGLTADERLRLGKRGVRLDETKPGSGLGLSIVSDLVHSYNGSFKLEASPRGGVSARLELPAAP
jgi:signal transduction histidine kinase